VAVVAGEAEGQGEALPLTLPVALAKELKVRVALLARGLALVQPVAVAEEVVLTRRDEDCALLELGLSEGVGAGVEEEDGLALGLAEG
jgi:hypothetical protein